MTLITQAFIARIVNIKDKCIRFDYQIHH